MLVSAVLAVPALLGSSLQVGECRDFCSSPRALDPAEALFWGLGQEQGIVEGRRLKAILGRVDAYPGVSLGYSLISGPRCILLHVINPQVALRSPPGRWETYNRLRMSTGSIYSLYMRARNLRMYSTC